VHEFFLNYFTLLKIRCFLGSAAIPRRGVEGSFCQKTEANSKPPEADQFVYVRAKARFISAALIKEKVTSLRKTEQQTTLKGKSRGIKNVTLASAGEMRFAR
jgi:hypothetical protein